MTRHIFSIPIASQELPDSLVNLEHLCYILLVVSAKHRLVFFFC